jgi:hypothetical protein
VADRGCGQIVGNSLLRDLRPSLVNLEHGDALKLENFEGLFILSITERRAWDNQEPHRPVAW